MATKAKQFDAIWSGILDDDGLPVSGGKVYTYVAGTSTLKDTYTNRDKTLPAASNPIILDAYGRAEVYGDGLYYIVVKDANDVTLWDMDNVEIIAQSANLILDGDELTSQSVNGNIDIQPTGTGVMRVGGTNNGTGDAQITTIQSNKDIDIAPNGTGKVYLNKNDSGSTGINIFIDEDSFASNRADAVPTQQSVKAYVSSQISATAGKNNLSSGYLPNGGGEFDVTIQSPAAMAVDIAANGNTWYNATSNSFYTPTSNPTLTITTADASNPRWDLVQINASSQTINVKAGTAAANPTKPSPDSGYEAIAYVYVGAAVTTISQQVLIQNLAGAAPVKVGDNHFKTNFSINQKEDTEDSEYETQQYFQNVSYGTTFDTVDQDKTFLHTVDTFAVRADCDEITYTGSWSNDDSTNYRFGRAKLSSSASASATFSFFGVAVGVSLYGGTTEGPITAELSTDGGSTYSKKITINHDTGSATFNNFYDLYTGLPIGEYKVKITLLATRVIIDHFYYTTYCIQRPASLFACKSGSGGTAASISEVPPATTLLTGTWVTKNDVYTENWNSVQSISSADGDYLEFKFYGSKVWVEIMQDTDASIDLDFTIDGATTYVRNTSGFNPDTPNNPTSFAYRIDNGSLPEGIHILKITRTSGTAGNKFYFCGIHFYSATAPSTICRSLILGNDSYAIGADNSSLSYSGTWVGLTDDTTAFLRRRNVTVTNASYVSITTPNDADLKAIYMVCSVDNSTIGAEIKLTLAGSKTRYVDTQTGDYEQGSFIIPIYDSFFDGALHNQELRVTHNDTTTSTEFKFQGLIFEIGDPVGTSSLMAMPKWTRYSPSTVNESLVSNTYRLDVYGVKSDQSQGRMPQIHGGWGYGSGNTAFYFRAGVMRAHFSNAYTEFFSRPISASTSVLNTTEAAISYGINYFVPGVFYKQAGSSASSYWQKNHMILKEVV